MITQYKYGLADCLIAAWTSTGSYGTSLDVVAISRAVANIQTVSAELTGDDTIVDSHARAIKAEVTLQFGFNSLAPYALITGLTHESSGATKDRLKIGNFNPPYVGIIIQMLATNGGGDTHLFIPKAKLMSGFQLGGAYGEYVTPEITFTAIRDSTEEILQLHEHTVATTLAIPPVY